MASLLTASIPRPGTKRRFAAFSAADLELKRKNSVPASTKKANEKAGRVFNNYLTENAVDKQVHELDSGELASLLGKFYFEARTVNGDLYKCSSLENLRHSLNRYLKQFHPMIDIIKDPEFRAANDDFKAAMSELKDLGRGQVDHYPPLEKSDLQLLYNSSHLSVCTPTGLFNKVHFDIRYYFCRRGGENISTMTKDTFEVRIDADTGVKYVVKSQDELTKNHRENDREQFSGYMPESRDNPKCPVSSFEKYLKHLNPDCRQLWQRPRLHVEPEDEVWYCNQCVGVKKLGTFMKDLSHNCGLSRIYTNHSCRSSGATILSQCGFAAAQVMAVTGHKSVQSLTQYQKVGSGEKLAMGSVLSSALQGNTPQKAIQNPNHDRPALAPRALPGNSRSPHQAHDSAQGVQLIDFQFTPNQLTELFSSFEEPKQVTVDLNSSQTVSNVRPMQFFNCNVNIYQK